MTVSVSDVISHTPTWVFVLLAYLTYVGLMRLRPRVRQLGRVWITPGIFIAWGLVGLFQRPGDFSSVLLHWTIGALIGGVLGSLGHIELTVDRPRQLIRLGGSVLPLIRILVIFGAHYALQVAMALHPDRRAALTIWDTYVSGASAGYFIGWSIRFLAAYRTAPQNDLGPAMRLNG